MGVEPHALIDTAHNILEVAILLHVWHEVVTQNQVNFLLLSIQAAAAAAQPTKIKLSEPHPYIRWLQGNCRSLLPSKPHLGLGHLVRVERQEVQGPCQGTASSLMPCHQHGQQVISQLSAVHLLTSGDQEAKNTGVT